MIQIPEELVDDVIEFFAKTPMPWVQSNPFLQRFGQARDQHRRQQTKAEPAAENGDLRREARKALP